MYNSRTYRSAFDKICERELGKNEYYQKYKKAFLHFIYHNLIQPPKYLKSKEKFKIKQYLI
ncbi:MAG: hypothetical protein KAX28_01210, partial [Candidatus Marinimicrobia bacterium]|nr:hypothetical protein [Candidatus Neomarinimicrobiota bacterium]